MAEAKPTTATAVAQSNQASKSVALPAEVRGQASEPTGTERLPIGNSQQIFITVNVPDRSESHEKAGLGIEAIKGTAQFLGASAWPVAIVIIAWLLRKEIAAFLGRLRKLKWGDFEATVEEKIEELGDPPQAPDPANTANLGFAVDDLAKRSPIDAIVTAWVGVERAVEAYLVLNPPAVPSSTSSRLTAFSRYAVSSLPADLRGTFAQLKDIRNQVVHEAKVDLSSDAVRKYVEQAAYVSGRLNGTVFPSMPGN